MAQMLWMDRGREKMDKRTSRQREPHRGCKHCVCSVSVPVRWGKAAWGQCGWKGRREMAEVVQRGEGTRGQCSWNGCGVGPDTGPSCTRQRTYSLVREMLLGLMGPFYYTF